MNHTKIEFGPDYDPTDEREELVSRMRALNQSRKRVGKKAAGRLLDGRTHDEFPGGAS